MYTPNSADTSGHPRHKESEFQEMDRRQVVNRTCFRFRSSSKSWETDDTICMTLLSWLISVENRWMQVSEHSRYTKVRHFSLASLSRNTIIGCDWWKIKSINMGSWKSEEETPGMKKIWIAISTFGMFCALSSSYTMLRFCSCAHIPVTVVSILTNQYSDFNKYRTYINREEMPWSCASQEWSTADIGQCSTWRTASKHISALPRADGLILNWLIQSWSKICSTYVASNMVKKISPAAQWNTQNHSGLSIICKVTNFDGCKWGSFCTRAWFRASTPRTIRILDFSRTVATWARIIYKHQCTLSRHRFPLTASRRPSTMVGSFV